MFEEKDLKNLLGKADESFNESFNNTLTKLKTMESKRHSTRISTKAITFIIIICILALSGTAYAVSQFTFIGNTESVDTGGGFILVAITQEQENEMNFAYSIYSAEIPVERRMRFDADLAQEIRDLLINEVFTIDGEEFDFLVYDYDKNGYYIDDMGKGLFNIAGEELGEIMFVPENHLYDGSVARLAYNTKKDIERQYQLELAGIGPVKLTYDYEDAVEHMNGFRFRFPDVYTEQFDFNSVIFRIQKPKMLPGYADEMLKDYLLKHYPELYEDRDDINIDTLNENTEEFDPRGVTVYVTIGGSPGLYYWAEVPRDEENYIQKDWEVGVNRIEEWLISETDTTVYKLISSEFIRYTWKHDGIVYMLFNFFDVSDQFTDEEFMEIIYSMVT